MPQQVFISHSAADEQVARSLKSMLEQSGATVWLASDAIRPGDRVADVIRDQLQKSNIVLLLIGRNPSEWARYEWSQALRLAYDETHQTRVIPVLLDDAEAPAFLGEQQAIRLDSEQVTHNQLEWPSQSPEWEWRTSATAKRNLADRLTEISSIATSLEPDSE
jgi:TIR domain